MHKVVREIVEKAEQIGWEYKGQNGAGHHVLVHENGAKETLPATPSEYRGLKNALSRLQRKAGQKLPKQKKRKARKAAELSGFDLEEAAQHNEHYHQVWDTAIERLRHQHAAAIQELAALTYEEPTRAQLQEARITLHRIRAIEHGLEDFNQPYTPFDITTLPDPPM